MRCRQRQLLGENIMSDIENKFKVGDWVKLVKWDIDIAKYVTKGGKYEVEGVSDNCIRVNGNDWWLTFQRFELCTSVEHTGGSSSYYDIDVGGSEVRCLDIIEKLQMTFSEGNAFKAIWRTAAARQGKKKAGNNAVYDAEKVCFFGDRMLVAAKGENV